jgi:hypothetical protein
MKITAPIFIKIGDKITPFINKPMKIFIQEFNPKEGVIIADGRPVKLIDGKWVYIPK